MHALRAFVAAYPAVDADWYATSNTLAWLAVEDEPALAALLADARRRGICAASFHEPDLGDALTAIALEPTGRARRICRKLPLALQGGR